MDTRSGPFYPTDEDMQAMSGLHGVSSSSVRTDRPRTKINVPQQGATRPEDGDPSRDPPHTQRKKRHDLGHPALFGDNLFDQPGAQRRGHGGLVGGMGLHSAGLGRAERDPRNGMTTATFRGSQRRPLATRDDHYMPQHRNASGNGSHNVSAPVTKTPEIISVDDSDEEHHDHTEQQHDQDPGPSRRPTSSTTDMGRGHSSTAHRKDLHPRSIENTFGALFVKDNAKVLEMRGDNVNGMSSWLGIRKRPEGPIQVEEPNHVGDTSADPINLFSQETAPEKHQSSIHPHDSSALEGNGASRGPRMASKMKPKASHANLSPLTERKHREHKAVKLERKHSGSPTGKTPPQQMQKIGLNELVVSDNWRSDRQDKKWMKGSEDGLIIGCSSQSDSTTVEIRYKDIESTEASDPKVVDHALLSLALLPASQSATKLQAVFPDFDPRAVSEATRIRLFPVLKDGSGKGIYSTIGQWKVLLTTLQNMVHRTSGLDANGAKVQAEHISRLPQRPWPSASSPHSPRRSRTESGERRRRKQQQQSSPQERQDQDEQALQGTYAASGSGSAKAFEILQPRDYGPQTPSPKLASQPMRQKKIKIPEKKSSTPDAPDEKPADSPAEQPKKRKSPEDANETILIYPYDGKETSSKFKMCLLQRDLDRLGEGEFLNDTIIEFGLQMMHEEIRQRDPELADQIYIFNSFFYTRLCEANIGKTYPRVKKWTSKVNLFDKKYLIIPINEDFHWYFTIVINPIYMTMPQKGKSEGVRRRSNRHLTPDSDAEEAKVETEDNQARGDVTIDEYIGSPRKRLEEVQAADQMDVDEETSTYDFKVERSKRALTEISGVATAPIPGLSLHDDADKTTVGSDDGQDTTVAGSDHASSVTDEIPDADFSSLTELDVESIEDGDSDSGTQTAVVGRELLEMSLSTPRQGSSSSRRIVPVTDLRSPSKRPQSSSSESDGKPVSIDMFRQENERLQQDTLWQTATTAYRTSGYSSSSQDDFNETEQPIPVLPRDERSRSQHFRWQSPESTLVPAPYQPRRLSREESVECLGSQDPLKGRRLGGGGGERTKIFPGGNRDPTPPQESTPKHLKMYTIRSHIASQFAAENLDLEQTIIITFDSLGTRHVNVQKKLRNYLWHEATDKLNVRVDYKDCHQPTYFSACVPNQPNFCDCGIYLLHYFERFFSDPDRFLVLIMSNNTKVSEEWLAASVKGKRQEWRTRIMELSESWKQWKKENGVQDEPKKKATAPALPQRKRRRAQTNDVIELDDDSS